VEAEVARNCGHAALFEEDMRASLLVSTAFFVACQSAPTLEPAGPDASVSTDAGQVELDADAATPPDAAPTDAAYADAGSDAGLGCGETITVSVRVHLLGSNNASLKASWTANEAREGLAAAADFWARHCIGLVEESVVTTVAETAGEVAFAAATARAPIDRMRLRDALSDAVPRAALLNPGWNVFVIHDFNAPSVGVFVPDPGLQSIFIAQQRVDGTPLGTFVLAHEFGHSFSLEHHVGADRESNLMRDDPHLLIEPVELTPEQVGAARAQAGSGAPRGG
jgi:hypothetical protein